jgi:hypothetical protein
MRQLFILTIFLAVSCRERHSKERLFESIYHGTFVPKEGVTIQFIDSTSYIVSWGPDSAKNSETNTWSIENRLTGTYLIMDSSEMKLETLSDTVVTFSKGEFKPRFVKVVGN